MASTPRVGAAFRWLVLGGRGKRPSLAHFTADGKMASRHVPQGMEPDYAGAPYDVIGSLPAILAKREGNRGIEGLAVSPDKRFLYFIMQNPLANPDRPRPPGPQLAPVQDRARHQKAVGEFVYMSTIRRASGATPRAGQAILVSAN